MTIWTDLQAAIEAEAIALGYTGTLEEIGIDQPYAAKLITLLEIRSKLAEITGGGGGGGDVTIVAPIPTGTNSIGQVTANAGTNLNTSALTLDTTTGTTNTRIGDLAETAPASDTASSGLNGRLQRIAQRITSLIALLPSALGSTSSAGSLSMTVAQAQFTETQLTAPNSTTSRSMAGYNQAFIQVVVASINTNVVIRIEGSNDGTNWSNLSALNTDTTITANGVYSFSFNQCPANIRTTFVSESGGTAATVDVITRVSA